MRYCVSLPNILLCFLAVLLIAGCYRGNDAAYGFIINDVSINRAYQSLDIRLQQQLELSQQAQQALLHGVTLTINLELELRNDNNMIVTRRDSRRFQLRYMPLSERYQLLEDESDEFQFFSRLRHVFAAIDDLSVQLATGPLPPGKYELRTRIRLDESRLPAPMQLPAMFSSQWQHDSEWSVWPFIVSV